MVRQVCFGNESGRGGGLRVLGRRWRWNVDSALVYFVGIARRQRRNPASERHLPAAVSQRHRHRLNTGRNRYQRRVHIQVRLQAAEKLKLTALAYLWNRDQSGGVFNSASATSASIVYWSIQAQPGA